MWNILHHVHRPVRVWDRFIRARRGNVAIIFAFSLIPMLILVGVAIDYSRANSVRAAMQIALDSTALALSKRVGMLTTDQVQTSAQDYFKAIFTRPEAANVKVTAAYSSASGSQVVITSSADMATEFLGMIGYKTFHIATSATAKWGSSRLRVALVLDTTGSMSSSGKIEALKTATKKLLSQLKSAASVNEDVYVSIIPFAKDVRIEPNYAAPWNDWVYWDNNAKSDPTSWDATHGTCSTSNNVLTRSNCLSTCSIAGNNSESTCTAAGVCSISGHATNSSCTAAGTCSISGKSSQSACTSAGACSTSGYSTQSSCTSAGVCSKSSYKTQSQCLQKGETWTAGVWTAGVWTQGVWTAGRWTPGIWTPDLASRNDWTGCVTDRGPVPPNRPPSGGNAYDQNVNAATLTDDDSRFPPDEKATCPPAMMELNYDWPAMNDLVDGLTANGSTNQPIGLVWGWQSLVGGGPFTAPLKTSGYDYTDVIILLSDGLNTQNRWDGDGSHTSTAVDARMRDSSGTGTCANINAHDINLYTIQVNTGGDPTSTLLKNCAGTAPTETVARKFPDPNKFFLLTTADQIITTFDKIGTELTKLRIAQ